jgi:two-component system OmpR family response regulator
MDDLYSTQDNIIQVYNQKTFPNYFRYINFIRFFLLPLRKAIQILSLMASSRLIFIVDDDPVINNLIVKRFSAEGYNVLPFENGEDCLAALDKNPELIILDYFFMSNKRELMNGMEIFEKIKQIKPQTPVIMLSGQDKGEIVLELARKGIDDYVIKDVNLIDNLNTAITEYFSRN